MTLPDNTNELLSVMDGWTDLHINPNWHDLRGMSPNDFNAEAIVPDYRACLDAIEPVFTRLCPGWTVWHLITNNTDRKFAVKSSDGNTHYEAALASAMCLAVLATRKPEATTPD